MRNRLVCGAVAALLMTAFVQTASAATLEFTIGASGQAGTLTDGQTAMLSFQLDTDAPLLNTPTSEAQPHSFGGAAVIDLSLMVFDNSGGKIHDIGYAGDISGLADVQQSRAAGNFGVPIAGTNRLSVDLNALDLTGVSVATGFLNLNLSASTFLSFNQQATDFVADVLFDNPAALLSNAQLGLPIDRDNFDIAADPGLIGINFVDCWELFVRHRQCCGCDPCDPSSVSGSFACRRLVFVGRLWRLGRDAPQNEANLNHSFTAEICLYR